MKVTVVKGFSLTDGFTYPKGTIATFDKTLATRLIERGYVRSLEDATKTSKRKSKEDKASKKSERKNI